jgi:Uma2 family endonuclease
MAIATGVSLEEYLHTEYEPDCDYVDGTLEDRNVGKRRHSRTQKRLIEILSPLVVRLGLEPLPEQRLQVSATRVRIPDVCLTPLEDDSEVPGKPPALCIEILSPDDRVGRLVNVVADYLAFGVPMIWIIDPYDRAAFVVTQQNPAMQPVDTLRWNDVVLELSEILPE